MNWRKAAAWSAGGVVVLGAAAAVAIYTLVDSESLKKAAAGHGLVMSDVALTFWPVPAITAEKVSLPDPPCCKLLQADRVRADLALWALLSGNVRFKRVLLQGARAGFEGGESWVIEEAVIESAPDYRDVRIEANVTRYGQPLTVKAEFADLSRFGVEGAASEGKIELDWKQTHVAATGRFPLEKKMQGGMLNAEVKSASIQDVFAFFGIERRKTAPVEIRLEAREAQGKMQVSKLAASLGKLTVTGDAQVTIKDGKPVIDARLAAGRLDWLQMLVDSGGTLRPKPQNEEVFHDNPIAWRLVTTLGALDGSRAEWNVKSMKLANGLELTNVKARMALGDGRMALAPFATAMLGGIARGSLKFDGRKKAVEAKINAQDLLLERWLRERGSKVPFTGGPMAVQASLTFSGGTYRDFAASINGPLKIRMGRGTWNSKVASEYEGLMVSALASKQSDQIAFECAAVNLDFRQGRANGKRLMGARSSVSQLLTDGFVDFREEQLDLRGRVKASSGASVGLAMFAGEVQIHGRLAHPKVRMDPDGRPVAVARVAAAIASAGATVLGGALLDVAQAKKDPCDIIRPQDVK